MVKAKSFNPYDVPYDELKSKDNNLCHRFRLAMLVHGVDLMGWPGGLVSCTHGQAEADETVTAFAEAIAMLKRDGDI